jgi:hypothetical protein
MIVYSLVALLFAWVVVLTFLLFQTKKHYKGLITRTRKQSIDEILDTLLTEHNTNQSEINVLKKHFANLEKNSKLHLQKIGLVHFDAFERSGGGQSFVLALLDEFDNGATLNFIHTRDGLRVYTKRIKNGTGIETELSDEERKAIKNSS